MNHKITAMMIILAAMLFLVVGCSKEKEENPGNETAACMQCHGDNGALQENVQAYKTEWALSIHASDITLNRNGVPCAGCHTNQGFITRLAGGFDAVVTVPNPSPIHCFTCHAPHTNFNFDLRTAAPVDLLMGGIFNLGHGNLCANCHQARIPSPAVSDSTVVSSHWGPHDATQANMLSGQGAYVFNGDGTVALDTSSAEGYNGAVNSPHTTLVTNGCPTCHMATPFSDRAGGHQMGMTYESGATERDLVTGCNQSGCHSGLTDFNIGGKQDSIEALVVSLQTALQGAGIVDDSGAPIATFALNSVQAAALYNFLFVEVDRSLGVHNFKYDRDVLQASIAALAANREL